MTTENKRDLAADLVLCESVPAVYYDEGGGYTGGEGLTKEAQQYFESVAEGWPHAIRRAMAVEAQVGRLQAELVAEEDKRCALEMEAHALALEVERLRSVLEQMDDRKNPMMPRSQMARLAKETLDHPRVRNKFEIGRYRKGIGENQRKSRLEAKITC